MLVPTQRSRNSDANRHFLITLYSFVLCLVDVPCSPRFRPLGSRIQNREQTLANSGGLQHDGRHTVLIGTQHLLAFHTSVPSPRPLLSHSPSSAPSSQRTLQSCSPRRYPQSAPNSAGFRAGLSRIGRSVLIAADSFSLLPPSPPLSFRLPGPSPSSLRAPLNPARIPLESPPNPGRISPPLGLFCSADAPGSSLKALSRVAWPKPVVRFGRRPSPSTAGFSQSSDMLRKRTLWKILEGFGSVWNILEHSRTF